MALWLIANGGKLGDCLILNQENTNVFQKDSFTQNIQKSDKLSVLSIPFSTVLSIFFELKAPAK